MFLHQKLFLIGAFFSLMITQGPVSFGESIGDEEPTICSYPVRLESNHRKKAPLVKIISKKDCNVWKANHRHKKP